MQLEHLYFISQIAAAAMLLASILFVGVQIRQNTRAQKVAAVGSLAGAIAAINVPAMENPALGAAVAKCLSDWDAASTQERIIAHYFLFSFFKLHENAWYQNRAGVLDAEQWAGWDGMLRAYYHSAGVQKAWWPARRNAYSPAFQAYLAQSADPAGQFGALSALFGPSLA